VIKSNEVFWHQASQSYRQHDKANQQDDRKSSQRNTIFSLAHQEMKGDTRFTRARNCLTDISTIVFPAAA